ncbi:hypothetical protein ACFWWT_16430 [Streptomyces sp. NPDC058676]|uniref:hypothetical protein n=1 Tax=unclassified Streptomyces TaxID=2593676 RepID=UPI00365ED2C0
MNTPSDHPDHPSYTDDELAEFDVGVLLRYGLTAAPGPRRTALFGDGAAAAAVILDRLGTQPRSVAFLAEVVRAGGLAYATELPEPLPRPEASVVVRDWLEAATQLAGGAPADETAARWLGAVATIIELKHLTRARAGQN